MTKIDNKHYIWAEKYRPQTVEDLIVPESVKSQLIKWVEDEQIPNIGLWGNIPGTGKTSLATAIIKELDADYLWLNASAEGGIDTMRSEIPKFAQGVSVDGRAKIVILDESDALTSVPNGAQFAIRGIIEKYAKNCRFILTGNYKDRIIEPILNRLINFDLDELTQSHKKEYGKSIISRLKFILKNENVKYNEEDLPAIIKNNYPSIREMTLDLQKLTTIKDNELVLEVNDKILETSFIMKKVADELFSKDNKDKAFTKVRKLITEINDPDSFYTWMWKHIDTYVDEAKIPQFVLVLSEFQDKTLRARDKTITLASFCATVILKYN